MLTLGQLGLASSAGLGLSTAAHAHEAAGRERPGAQSPFFIIHPVGRVQHTAEGPTLKIFPAYQPALKGLEEWSHVIVLWWFDRNDTPERRSILQVHPFGNRENPLTGVFACRSPVRPNLIALTVCKIKKIEDGVVYVDAIDAWDQTPIIDLKPLTPRETMIKVERVPKWTSTLRGMKHEH